MGVWDSLAYKLGFAQEQNEFELLETEAGTPSFWSSPSRRETDGMDPAPGGPGKAIEDGKIIGGEGND